MGKSKSLHIVVVSWLRERARGKKEANINRRRNRKPWREVFLAVVVVNASIVLRVSLHIELLRDSLILQRVNNGSFNVGR